MSKAYIIIDRASDTLIQGTYSNKKKAFNGVMEYINNLELDTPQITTYEDNTLGHIKLTYTNMINQFKKYDTVNLNYDRYVDVSIREVIIK